MMRKTFSVQKNTASTTNCVQPHTRLEQNYRVPTFGLRSRGASAYIQPVLNVPYCLWCSVPAASSISQPTTPGRVTLPAQLSTYGRWAFFVAAAWFEINSLLNRAVFAGGWVGLAALTFKTMSSLTPAYLNDLIQTAVPVRPLRSSDAPLLNVPRTRTEFARRSFSVAALHT